jgi:hypothetical protein
MSTFLEQEKLRYIATIDTTQAPLFSPAARPPGLYRRSLRPFCLPLEHAAENLAPAIRADAITYFAAHGIHWHDGYGSAPSNHLCSSQVLCINFLFPFSNEPRALAELLRPIFPRLARMLPVEDDRYVAFEWIGERNYLKERVARGARRTRGANSTSADAMALFERDDGRRQIVLIEWKYTERYGQGSLRFSPHGTDRLEIYAPFLDLPDCPIQLPENISHDALFVAPFDQLMRLQLLAREMERSHERGADTVSVLHVSPARNNELGRVTSEPLRRLGSSVTEVWSKLVSPSDRFASSSVEKLWTAASTLSSMRQWRDYLRVRYPWVEG